jgi:ferritin-like metal-binding protein YciE/CRP-like cAMP-binding protein
MMQETQDLSHGDSLTSSFIAGSNGLVGRLPDNVLETLRPRMTLVSLARGELICRSGEGLESVYFPCSGMISATLDATRSAAEAYVIGREGFAAPPAMHALRCPYTFTVQMACCALVIDAEFLRMVVRRDRMTEDIFHRFQHVLLLQAASSAVAHATERLEARLARWLLMCADRVGPRLPVVHSDISRALAVRRAGVTLAIHMLESEGAVRARRARIEVLDRNKLRRRAGPTYGIAEDEYARLIGRENGGEPSWAHDRIEAQEPVSPGTFRWIDCYAGQALPQGVAGPFETRRGDMPDTPLKDLLVHGLKDMYFAENAIIKALPKMIDAAESPDLKEALSHHRDETNGHVERLEEAFRAIDVKSQSTPCEAMKGILKEGDEVVEKFGKSPAADAAIIFACQAVEHYEITRYGSLREWAENLGFDDVASILKETLDEEYAADDKLTALARREANPEGGGREARAR